MAQIPENNDNWLASASSVMGLVGFSNLSQSQHRVLSTIRGQPADESASTQVDTVGVEP